MESLTHKCSGEDCKFTTNCDRGHLMHHIQHKIPTRINPGQIDLLPKRADFLDTKKKAAFNTQITQGRPVLFMPNDVMEKSEWTSGAMRYKIYMFGVLPDGSKTLVIVDDIEVYVDIMVPHDTNPDAYEKVLHALLMSNNFNFTKIGDIDQYQLHDFQENKTHYKRVFFNNLQDRKLLITHIYNENVERKKSGKPIMETAADDLAGGHYYFPKVARDYSFSTADWNYIEKYTRPANTTTNCTYVLRVSIRDIRPLGAEKRKELLTPGGFLSKVIDRDLTMTVQWDIETYSQIQNGLVPTVDDDYTIFNMCGVYFWHWSEAPLVEICVITAHATPRPGIDVVVECPDETNVLRAHMEIMGRLAPDLMAAFNGANFDWPLYREKLRRNKMLVELKRNLSSLPLNTGGKYADTEESVLRWCFRNEKVKIDAENDHPLKCVSQFPGLLDTDVLPTFLQMYNRAEIRKAAGLNYFLARNKIPLKDDMPYKRMFRIYERSLKLQSIRSCHCGQAQEFCTLCAEKIPDLDCKPADAANTIGSDVEYTTILHGDLTNNGHPSCCYCGKKPRNANDMADVGYYCVIDCVRPQQLYVRRTIVPDKRELSTMSFVSLNDSFYRANGGKVRNLIGHYCNKRGMAFSNAKCLLGDSDKDHYPGAWVFPPNRGLHSDGFVDVDVMGLNGEKVRRRMRCRPITGLDFNSLYPSEMMTDNLSPDMVVRTRERAEALITLGYELHRIEPFAFERGAKKGAVNNKQLEVSGWTVRHKGVFTPEDKKIVAEYVKHETYEWEDHKIRYATRDGPSEEQKLQLDVAREAKIKIKRTVDYPATYGRDVLPGEIMGIFPFIVKMLFDMRVPLKREFVRLSELLEVMDKDKLTEITVGDRVITYDDVVFDLNKVNAKQKALKVLANTFYGESGNFRSSIYELLVAAGVTCNGQAHIKSAAMFVTALGFTVHYGDSVAADTPILVRSGNVISYQTIESIGNEWTTYDDKESSLTNLEVWTERGWTLIKKVIRHKTSKTMYRVLTHTGVVDVTSDHSLLDEHANKIKPTDVKIGSKLLHYDLPDFNCAADSDNTKLNLAKYYQQMSKIGQVIIDADINGHTLAQSSDNVTNRDTVKKIIELGPCTGYVYDLETENHHFAAGIGRMVVHNTDSIYITCPDSLFEECDAEYERGMAELAVEFDGVDKTPEPVTDDERRYKTRRTELRVAWWTKQVDITMKTMADLREKVSDHFLKLTGTRFLNMAYEEVLYPTVFTGKKKYYGNDHLMTINFDKQIEKHFIKGIDVIKQGQALITKQLGFEFMVESILPENEHELMDLAEEKIRKFYGMDLSPKLFVLSGKYKPDKKNIPVHVFHARMKELANIHKDDPVLSALYEPPEPGDKFEYIIVKKNQRYTLQGKKIDIKKGDHMEFVRVFRASQETASPMEIDLDYYMKNAIVGLFARFIAYHPRFQPPAGMFDVDDKDQYREMDIYCVKAAGKYLESICDSITNFDKGALAKQGRDYRKIYKHVVKTLRADMMYRYGGIAHLIHNIDIHGEADDARALSTRIIGQMKEQAIAQCANSTAGADYVRINTERSGLSVFELERLFNSDKGNAISKTRVNACNKEETVIVDELYKALPKCMRFMKQYERSMIRIIEDMRRDYVDEIILDECEIDDINELCDDDHEVLTEVYELMIRLHAIYRTRADSLNIVNELGKIKALM